MNDDPISTRRVTLLPETPRTVLSPEEQALVTTGAPLVVRAANRLGARYADLVG
jgi:hypothetical protein